MVPLLNLLAAIALLVWGTQVVRTGVLRVFGESLRRFLSERMGTGPRALLAGMGVTCVLQSSTATCLITASFLSKGLVSTAAALAVMLGADVGTALMAVVFSLDLSWVSPLLIFTGVVMTISRDRTTAALMGKCLLGVGLMTLALHLIVESTRPMTQSPEVRALLVALPADVLLHIVVGALLTVMAYSSLAIVLLVATLTMQGLLPVPVALGLVMGANVGSGLLGLMSTAKSPVEARRLPLGNLVFKLSGCLVALPLLPYLPSLLAKVAPSLQGQVVVFHLGFNTMLAVVMVGLTGWLARKLESWWVAPSGAGGTRPQHLDPLALSTPSLAICCAAREALHQADVVETMLRGIENVIRSNDLRLSEQLRKMDDTVDGLYNAIKFYLTQVSREALSERESRRWTDIVSFTINMEQIGDIVERVLQDIEDKKIRKNRRFSDAGMAEICHLHERLVSNLRLSMSVFLDGQVADASRLLEEKARFRDLEHAYAASHIARLRDNTAPSIETSALHLDLISELKRINSHICSTAYPILQTAGVLTPTRLRSAPVPTPASSPTLVQDLAA
ncbi:MAG: Na/Pi cotransporter family protein [Pseudomonadota bacterium]